MIDVSNLKDALKALGFVAYGDIYEKAFSEIGCSLKVDFQAKRLIYPNEIRGRERNDSFDQKENFVVFECVCRLLSKGYRPEHIELEKEWHLGHDAKGGRADICVSDTSGSMLFIIECKTWGREYDKALNNTKSDGAQLFSYWQQEQSCKWLVLYASDLRNDCIAYKAPTIGCSDDANIILLSKKDKSIKLYRDAHTTLAKYEAWKETYGSQIHDDLIFSEDSVAYQIGVKPLRKKDLRDFAPDDKIVNKFEEILRHNNVSDKENAFNRLVALFICKLVDESTKSEDDEVEFQYKQGTDTYETLQDRLQRLHRDGMKKFMREKTFYISADYPERLFSTYTGSKRKQAIESGTTEFGMTSSGKAICRVNDYLHFLLGNGIVADVFSEYRNAVKNLMSLLVYKYSIQGKKVLHEQPFLFIGGNDVHFDEIDFHCFIEYFDAKEISALLKKHHIETITFQNMDLVETAVKNLLDYYSSAVRATKNNIDVIGLQTQIKNCLVLLGYVNISQGLVDKICSFILTQEFREILIDDKILFLDRQLERRKMYSKETSRIVENTLISYLDRNISALKNGERFEVLSRNTGINYCNLVHYIFAPGEKHFSRRLAARVSQIINNNLFQMNRQITQHYYGYVSNNQQKKLITWANKQSRTNFSFDLFEMLVQCDARISKAAKTQLKIFLRQRIDAAQENNNNGIVVYPNKHPYEELDQVGYWCLINVLNAKDFREFLGNSAAFDFYCEYTKFDFNKFDVSWLLNLYPHTLEQIAKNEKVKGCVRVAIADALNDGEIALSDSQRLQSILIKHFC